ncbi:MAG: response regulator transcription factor [Nitrospira sp.]|nr:response regulator transcription factor [Nitrospira sp.]MCB9776713.1 response regulator transcription factor [Nitrospiraceae bacterium]MDR4485012.1 response regulator transcription factor [Nitrospirales bacterium]
MRILLIEDDQIIADFIRKGMKEAGFIVDHWADGEIGLQAALTQDYDVGILDLMLPGVDGLTILDRIRQAKKSLPIIILSAKRTVDDRIHGLRRGGDDYLIKPFSFSELLARVESLLRRAQHVAEPSSLSFEDLQLDLLARTVSRAGKKLDLQPKEFALLEYLIRNAGHVVSKTMIMERVWDYHFDPGTNVVEARISKLREKIDKGFTLQLIHTVRGLGYVLKHPHA